MDHNSNPLNNYIEILTRLRKHFTNFLPGTPVPKLHKFLHMKISDFVRKDDPRREQILIQGAKVAVDDINANIPTEVLDAVTIQDFVDLIVRPKFVASCANVYDDERPGAVLDKTLESFPPEDLAEIQSLFEDSFETIEWPNRSSLWLPADGRTVSQAIGAGTK